MDKGKVAAGVGAASLVGFIVWTQLRKTASTQTLGSLGMSVSYAPQSLGYTVFKQGTSVTKNPGQTATFTVTAKDTAGNPLSGVSVSVIWSTFTSSGGTKTYNTTVGTGTTNSSGVATITWSVPDMIGTATFYATGSYNGTTLNSNSVDVIIQEALGSVSLSVS